MLYFEEMTAAEYAVFIEISMRNYTQSIADNACVSLEMAKKRADSQTASLLKEGMETPAHYFLKLMTKEGDVHVADLWYQLKPEKKLAFIFYIIVGVDHRGKGYGKQTIRLLEERLQEAGIEKLGLNVFGNNKIAFDLYQKMGFDIVDIFMQKRLSLP